MPISITFSVFCDAPIVGVIAPEDLRDEIEAVLKVSQCMVVGPHYEVFGGNSAARWVFYIDFLDYLGGEDAFERGEWAHELIDKRIKEILKKGE